MNAIEWLISEAKKPKNPIIPKKMTNKELSQLRFTYIDSEDSKAVMDEIEYRRKNNLTDDDYKSE